jgi:hypothetical protein
MEDANAENAWKDFSFVEVRFLCFCAAFPQRYFRRFGIFEM